MEASTALRTRLGRAGAALALTLSIGVVGPLAGTAAAAPSNDSFQNARRVVCENFPQYGGSNVGATAAPEGERLHGGDPGPVDSIWYSWTPTRNRSVTFSTAGSAIDTTMAVYTGTAVPRPGSNAGLVAENDDAEGRLHSVVSFNARRGTTYRIAIDGFSNREGSTRLSC